MSRIGLWFALVWILGVTVYLLVAPMYGEKMTWIETTPSGRQIQHTETGSSTLLDQNGPRILPALAIPLLLAGAPFATRTPRSRRIAALICGILLAIFAFLTSWTIGTYYFPPALALVLSAAAIRVRAQEVRA